MSLAFAFLMGGAGMQDTLLLCRMEQTLHRVCCCKLAASSVAEPVAHDELRRRPCCDEVSWSSAAIPPSSASASLVFVAPTLLEQRTPSSIALLPLAARVSVPRVVDVRDATGPPLHIKHRALLI